MTARDPDIRVSALLGARLQQDLIAFQPTDLISIIDPKVPIERTPPLPLGIRALRHSFQDGDAPDGAPPTQAIVGEIIRFLEDWARRHERGEPARLLAHCLMGVSRSTAIAYIALALTYEVGQEAQAFEHLLAITNKPWPSLPIVRLADERLGRGGRLIAPLVSYRARYPRRSEAYRRLYDYRGGDSQIRFLERRHSEPVETPG